MKIRIHFLLVLLSIGLSMGSKLWAQSPFFPESKISFEIKSGFPVNIPLPLTIRQEGYEAIHLSGARYKTEPLTLPPYWDLRLGYFWKNQGVGFRLTHHKLILTNLSAEVQRFSISHGFNILTANYYRFTPHYYWMGGAGIVIPHPESEVRQMQLDQQQGIAKTGYYIRGPAVAGAIGKRFYLIENFFVSLETQLTAGYVNVPVAHGEAEVWNIAFHFLTGLGYDFGKIKD